MDFINSLAQGFSTIGTWPVVVAMVVGSVIGIVVGVLPGVGPGVTIAVMLPFTYGMTPMAGISLLLGVYVGSYPGGAVTSTTLTPGRRRRASPTTRRETLQVTTCPSRARIAVSPGSA